VTDITATYTTASGAVSDFTLQVRRNYLFSSKIIKTTRVCRQHSEAMILLMP